MTQEFDDSRLDDPRALAEHDELLRGLALAGARIRRAAGGRRSGPRGVLDLGGRPRGVLVLGAEARLVRALLEPVCPVPFVAWQFTTLPGWVGALDLVVVLGSQGSDPDLMGATAEAVRRGAHLLVVADPDSPLAEQAASRSTMLLPVTDPDPLAAVVVVLEVLHEVGLGPSVVAEDVAARADEVAEECSPHADIANNPAKGVALSLADSEPLVWGGSVLAARAARRIAEALRRASGRPALAADATALLPVLDAARPRDPFRDPFENEGQGLPAVLLVIDDGSADERVRRERGELVSVAERRGVRICEVSVSRPDAGGSLGAYVELLQRGVFTAAYLRVGLGGSR